MSDQPTPTVVPSSERQYYEAIVYWNDFKAVRRHLNRLITGDAETDWSANLAASVGTFKICLSLNCGDGSVERGLHRDGVIQGAIGLDINQVLLGKAQSEAQRSGLPATYLVRDANAIDLTGLNFDLALNHAALHHVANIDHLTRQIARHLPANGLLVSYDYIGPHRNQYGDEAWKRCIELNDEAPAQFRQELRYPHLKTMLHVDPTEAVHSELIVQRIERYFDPVTIVPLGGAIAYILLFQANSVHRMEETQAGKDWIARVIAEDVAFTNNSIERSLFAYMVHKPKTQFPSPETMRGWTADERAREQLAADSGGMYYPRTELDLQYTAQYEREDAKAHRAADVAAAVAAVDAATAATPKPAPARRTGSSWLRRWAGRLKRLCGRLLARIS